MTDGLECYECGMKLHDETILSGDVDAVYWDNGRSYCGHCIKEMYEEE